MYRGMSSSLVSFCLSLFIKANGGSVVKLEKLADLLIADHAREKFAPAGSYSWKFIEESVKSGVLADLHEHLIKPKSTVRSVGPTQRAKMTRTPFTAMDDDLLMQWVMRAERTGGYLNGNKIYEELEQFVSTSSVFRYSC
jgi:hypothetical protein